MFVADTDYSGGAASSFSNVVSTSKVPSNVPASLFDYQRYGNSTYTIPNLTAGSNYTVVLFFAELYWTGAGDRAFNVAINGTQVLTNFDIFAAAGGWNIRRRRAVHGSGPALAAASPSSSPRSWTVRRSTASKSCTRFRHRSRPHRPALKATAGSGQTVPSWSAVTGATSYDIYRSTTSGGEGTTPYQTGVTATTFTDTGLTNGTTYYYTVTAVNSSGQGSQSSQISTTPQPIAITAHAGSSASGAEGSAISFAGSASGGSGALTYSWNFGDGNTTSGTQTPSHTYALYGTYTVTLTVSDAGGDVGTSTTTVTVTDVAPTVSIGGPYSGSVNVTTTFTGSAQEPSSQETSSLTYLWNFGDGTTSTLQNPGHFYGSLGTYTVYA